MRYITAAEQRELIESLHVSKKKQQEIGNLAQASQPWKDARKNRMTGAKAGAAAGHNFFCNHDKLLEEMMYDSFQGNEATAYGQEHEPDAVVVYENWLKTQEGRERDQVTHMGLHVD